MGKTIIVSDNKAKGLELLTAAVAKHTTIDAEYAIVTATSVEEIEHRFLSLGEDEIILILNTDMTGEETEVFMAYYLSTFPKLVIIGVSGVFGDRTALKYGAVAAFDKPIKMAVVNDRLDTAIQALAEKEWRLPPASELSDGWETDVSRETIEPLPSLLEIEDVLDQVPIEVYESEEISPLLVEADSDAFLMEENGKEITKTTTTTNSPLVIVEDEEDDDEFVLTTSSPTLPVVAELENDLLIEVEIEVEEVEVEIEEVEVIVPIVEDIEEAIEFAFPPNETGATSPLATESLIAIEEDDLEIPVRKKARHFNINYEKDMQERGLDIFQLEQVTNKSNIDEFLEELAPNREEKELEPPRTNFFAEEGIVVQAGAYNDGNWFYESKGYINKHGEFVSVSRPS